MEQQEHQNTYLFDTESAAEMGRLLLQDRLLNQAMGGYFPERADLHTLYHILDIGCGPGGWALGVAKQYPHIKVTGIDIGERMIRFARVQAQREGLGNTRFLLMNALERLAFADGDFDLVNIRTAFAWIPREKWPGVVQECYRVVRPGGTIRLTEWDISISNDPDADLGMRYATQLMHKMGYGFSPDGFTFGMGPMLGKLLMDAGCRNIQHRPHVVDYSYGAPLHTIELQNAMVAFRQLRPILVKMGIATEQELDRLYSQGFQGDRPKEDFRGLMYWLTAWGQKPES